MAARTKLHRILSAGAVALLAGAAVQAGTVGTAKAQISCPFGYFCLQQTTGAVIMIAEGEKRTFPGGRPVDATTNNTKLTYCVSSTPYDYALAPRQQTVRRHTVMAVVPSDYCAV